MAGQVIELARKLVSFALNGCRTGVAGAVNIVACQLSGDDLAVQFQQRIIQAAKFGAAKFQAAFDGEVIGAAECSKRIFLLADFVEQRLFLLPEKGEGFAGLFVPLCGCKGAGLIGEAVGDTLRFDRIVHFGRDGQDGDGTVIGKAFAHGGDACDGDGLAEEEHQFTCAEAAKSFKKIKFLDHPQDVVARHQLLFNQLQAPRGGAFNGRARQIVGDLGAFHLNNFGGLVHMRVAERKEDRGDASQDRDADDQPQAALQQVQKVSQ